MKIVKKEDFLKTFLTILLHVLIFQFKYAVSKEDFGKDNVKLAYLEKATKIKTCNSTYVPYENSCDECGKTYYNPNPRIVGGVEAVPYSWPAQVLIVQNIKAKYFFEVRPGVYLSEIVTKQFVCGGTLLNRYTVLSAAHCINLKFVHEYLGNDYILNAYTEGNPYYSTLESMFDIYVGAFDLRNLPADYEFGEPTVKKSVGKIIKHSSYNSVTFANDIALFILSKPAVLNRFVQPACLPDPSYGTYPPSNVNAYASGWGTAYEGGDVESKLRNVMMKVYDPTYCLLVEVLKTKDWNAQLCAGDTKGDKDTCQGDSGGGLYVFDGKLNKYVVVGITSYGEGCARPDKPGIYTRVSNYYSWITTNWATSGVQPKYINKCLFSLLLCLAICAKRLLFT